MIKSIEVKKLHGYLDKKIDFKNENYLIGNKWKWKNIYFENIKFFF